MSFQFPATHFFQPCQDCLKAGRGIHYPEATQKAGNPNTPVFHQCGDHDVIFVRGSKAKAVAHWNKTYGAPIE